jgi:hypothetical protein
MDLLLKRGVCVLLSKRLKTFLFDLSLEKRIVKIRGNFGSGQPGIQACKIFEVHTRQQEPESAFRQSLAQGHVLT